MKIITTRNAEIRPTRSIFPGLLILFFFAWILTACGGIPSPVPTDTQTPEVHTPTPVSSPTPDLAPTETGDQNQPSSESLTPTATPVPVTTPAAGADSYRLQPRDQAAALRILKESQDVPIPEEYQDLREFYQVSLIDEIWLDFPGLREDPALNLQMAKIKGLAQTYFSTYGLIHDHSVEPYRQLMENELNKKGSKELYIPDILIKKQGGNAYFETAVSQKLFDQNTSALVIKVYSYVGWDFFIIRLDASGHFSVLALYPEWERESWSDETFQITDLNANNRDEIAVTTDAWGTGFSHFCDRSFKLYEWDGSAFQNIMSDPLEAYAGTDTGRCLDISFLPDSRGFKKIQAGTSLNTLCPEAPYIQTVTFHWNGKGFVQEPEQISPAPKAARPTRCTIDWAIKAGPDNNEAMPLLNAALADWPAESNQDWGPAAQDYFRLKLATWNFRRGQINQGLKLLEQVRDHPDAPEYSLPSRVADTFLSTYKKKGVYLAVQDVDALYQTEIDQSSFCGVAGCDIEEMRQSLGFAEHEWDYEIGGRFSDDFQSIDALSMTFNQDQPTTLEDLYIWFEQNQFHPIWSIQTNLDGQGDPDWLVEVENKSNDSKQNELFVTLREYDQIHLFPVNFLPPVFLSSEEDESSTLRRFQNLYTDPGTSPINILQLGSSIYVFRFLSKNGTYKTIDNDLWLIPLSSIQYRQKIQDWKIEGNQLKIQLQQQEEIYTWDSSLSRLIPSGFAPELQEEKTDQAEQALYLDNEPTRSLEILYKLLSTPIWEDCEQSWVTDKITPPRLRPYLQYLLGLAYEQNHQQDKAVQAYWQLWHDYPASPYSLAAQSKLEQK
jgi:hypothetical protein